MDSENLLKRLNYHQQQSPCPVVLTHEELVYITRLIVAEQVRMEPSVMSIDGDTENSVAF